MSSAAVCVDGSSKAPSCRRQRRLLMAKNIVLKYHQLQGSVGRESGMFWCVVRSPALGISDLSRLLPALVAHSQLAAACDLECLQ